MHVNISGIHIEVTPAIHAYVIKKLEKVEKRFHNITNVHVTLDVEKKYQQKATAHMILSQGELNASSEADDLYKAIDEMVDKLDRQAVKHNEKLKKRSED